MVHVTKFHRSGKAASGAPGRASLIAGIANSASVGRARLGGCNNDRDPFKWRLFKPESVTRP
jgi:hypothetical protein